VIDKTYEPTFTHIFLSKLCKEGKITRVYTQNIDGLEEKAGIPKEKIVYCHGNLKKARCCSCRKEYDIELAKSINKCSICGNYIKPDVILYGEDLSTEFYNKLDEDFKYINCDCILIIGTSLKVYPVASLKNKLKKIPTIYVGKTKPDNQNFDGGLYSSFMPKEKSMKIYVDDCDSFFKKETDFIELFDI
jgi:NAD-dependent SIR2 family protein deacetylase